MNKFFSLTIIMYCHFFTTHLLAAHSFDCDIEENQFIFENILKNKISILEDKLIVQISMPKAGTNLLAKLISQLTLKTYVGSPVLNITNNADIFYVVTPGQLLQLQDNPSKAFLTNHMIYNEDLAKLLTKNKKFINFFILRDPRDLIVSFAFFMKKTEYWKKAYAMEFNELIFDLILRGSVFEGKPPITGDIKKFYESYLPWMNVSQMCTVRFEELVGPKGGGNYDTQLSTIERIARHLGIYLSVKEISEIANNLFGSSWTFREGQIGSWKKYFNEDHKKVFKLVAGQLLIDLGYEKDMNW